MIDSKRILPPGTRVLGLTSQLWFRVEVSATAEPASNRYPSLADVHGSWVLTTGVVVEITDKLNRRRSCHDEPLLVEGSMPIRFSPNQTGFRVLSRVVEKRAGPRIIRLPLLFSRCG